MNETMKNAMIGVCIALGLTGIGCAIYSASEASQARKLIGGAADHIGQMSHFDIDQRVVDQAVQDAVKRKSGEAVSRAASAAEQRMRNDIANRVKQAVEKSMGRVDEYVAKQMAEEVEGITRDDIIDDVVEKTTEKLVEKLGDELDGEAGRIGKIYQGIVAALK